MLSQAELEKAGDDLALLEKETAILLSDRQSLEPRVMDIGRRVAALDEEDGSLKIKIESGENGLRLSRQQSGQAEKLLKYGEAAKSSKKSSAALSTNPRASA